MSAENKPLLVIPLENYRRIMGYAKVCDSEVSGFMEVEASSEFNQITITKVYPLLPQEAGGADVEIDEDTVGDFNLELIKQGVKQLPRGFWHSHVDMQTFLSGTDVDTLDLFANNSFFLSVVVNKKESLHARLKVFAPFAYEFDDLEFVIDYGQDGLEEELKKEVEEKVTARAVQSFRTFADQAKEGQMESYDPSAKEEAAIYNKDFVEQSALEKLLEQAKDSDIRALPKEKDEALELVKKLDLVRAFDSTSYETYYIDFATGYLYLDIDKQVTYSEYCKLKGIGLSYGH